MQENFTSIEKKYFDYNSVPAQLYYPYTFLFQDLGPQVTLMDPKELTSLALIAVWASIGVCELTNQPSNKGWKQKTDALIHMCVCVYINTKGLWLDANFSSLV